MSLLSSTSGTPERVWSVVRLLDAHNGSLPRNELISWLSPPFRVGSLPRTVTGEPDGQATGAASSLELISSDAGAYHLTSPLCPTFEDFANQVHSRLLATPEGHPDYIVLEAFAWLVIETEREGTTSWIKMSNNLFADKVEAAIGSDDASEGGRRFNTSKLAAWRRWVSFVGLGTELADVPFYPYVTERLEYELRNSGLPVNTAIGAQELLKVIAQRMPYLDGGAIFNRVCSEVKFEMPPRQISRILSTALRDLADDGVISIGMLGDSADLYTLAPDGLHLIKTLQSIKIEDQIG